MGFISGPPEAVKGAVVLIEQFIEAPGSRLDTVLGRPISSSRPARTPSLPAPAPAPAPQAASAPSQTQLVGALAQIISTVGSSPGAASALTALAAVVAKAVQQQTPQ